MEHKETPSLDLAGVYKTARIIKYDIFNNTKPFFIEDKSIEEEVINRKRAMYKFSAAFFFTIASFSIGIAFFFIPGMQVFLFIPIIIFIVSTVLSLIFAKALFFTRKNAGLEEIFFIPDEKDSAVLLNKDSTQEDALKKLSQLKDETDKLSDEANENNSLKNDHSQTTEEDKKLQDLHLKIVKMEKKFVLSEDEMGWGLLLRVVYEALSAKNMVNAQHENDKLNEFIRWTTEALTNASEFYREESFQEERIKKSSTGYSFIKIYFFKIVISLENAHPAKAILNAAINAFFTHADLPFQPTDLELEAKFKGEISTLRRLKETDQNAFSDYIKKSYLTLGLESEHGKYNRAYKAQQKARYQQKIEEYAHKRNITFQQAESEILKNKDDNRKIECMHIEFKLNADFTGWELLLVLVYKELYDRDIFSSGYQFTCLQISVHPRDPDLENFILSLECYVEDMREHFEVKRKAQNYMGDLIHSFFKLAVTLPDVHPVKAILNAAINAFFTHSDLPFQPTDSELETKFKGEIARMETLIAENQQQLGTLTGKERFAILCEMYLPLYLHPGIRSKEERKYLKNAPEKPEGPTRPDSRTRW